MPVPTSITDLSTTASSNSPAGSESPTTADDYIRALSAIIKTQDNLNARKGANSDITSLSGLTTPLSIAQGGTGATTAEGALAALGGASTQGYKNAIINGDMVIAQRGTSFTGIATTPTYTLDRWRVSQTTSNTFTASQDSDIPTSKVVGSSLALTVTGAADTSIAAGDFSILAYVIEGYDARRFCGKTFTISFWVKSSITGTFFLSLINSGVDRSCNLPYTINAANTWEKKTLTVTNGLPQTSGTWNLGNGTGVVLRFVLATGTTFQNATTGSWLSGNFLGTSSQVNLVGTLSNVFKITDVQVELGAASTDFEQLPFDQQLERCRRYYEKSYNVGDAIGSVTTSGQAEFGQNLGGVSSANHAIRYTIPYLVSKRTGSPTVTAYSPTTGTSNRVRHLNTASPADITPTMTAYGERCFSFEVSQSTTFTDLRYSAHWVSDAEL